MLCATRLVIHELTSAGLARALDELRGVQHVHTVGPTVVGFLDQRILVVAVGAEGRLISAERRTGAELMGCTEERAR